MSKDNQADIPAGRWIDNIVKQIPIYGQSQDSLADQLKDLHRIATRLGLYDAADVIRTTFDLDRFSN